MKRYDFTLLSDYPTDSHIEEIERCNGEFVRYSDLEPRLALMREMAEIATRCRNYIVNIEHGPVGELIVVDTDRLLTRYEEMEGKG